MPPRIPKVSRQGAGTEPPPVMTWGQALPILVLSGIFDAIRFMFEWFIFFGPALAALYCTVKVGDTIGTTAAGAACAAGAGLVGFVGVEFIGPFGIIMAMVTGLIGWLTVGVLLMILNGRIFKENAMWFAASLLVSEVPLVGSVPAITLIVGRMYRTQIRTEKAALKKFNGEQAAEQLQERRQQEAQSVQEQALQQAQVMEEQEAANDVEYEELQDQEEVDQNARVTQSQPVNEEIPEDERKAA